MCSCQGSICSGFTRRASTECECIVFSESPVSRAPIKCLHVAAVVGWRCYWGFICLRVRFVLGSFPNHTRGIQAKEGEGSAGLFHVTAGGVLLRPPRCRWLVLISFLSFRIIAVIGELSKRTIKDGWKSFLSCLNAWFQER